MERVCLYLGYIINIHQLVCDCGGDGKARSMMLLTEAMRLMVEDKTNIKLLESFHGIGNALLPNIGG